MTSDADAISDATIANYATGLSRGSIERALLGAGMDLDALQPRDLVPLEDFHALGRLATQALVDLAGVRPEDRVLDAGTGIGGTARMLADQVGCHVTAVDLTAEYCEVAEWLDGLVGLGDRIDVRQGDVCALGFADASFDVVLSQHVQMNVADKDALYREARRVLAPGGRLALWDAVAGAGAPMRFPVPWAGSPEHSHLVGAEELRERLDAAGFEVLAWNDLTDFGVNAMTAVFEQPPAPLGLQVFVPDLLEKARNYLANLRAGSVGLVQAVLVAR